MDRFVIEFVVRFFAEHRGNGPLLKEIAQAVDEEKRRQNSGYNQQTGEATINESLRRLEQDYGLLEVPRDQTRRIGGRIYLVGAVWHYPEHLKQRWPCEECEDG